MAWACLQVSKIRKMLSTLNEHGRDVSEIIVGSVEQVRVACVVFDGAVLQGCSLASTHHHHHHTRTHAAWQAAQAVAAALP